jgi:hypothetical protein
MEYILEIPNNIPPGKCKEIIKRYEDDTRKQPGVAGSSGKVNPIKKSMDLCISGLGDWRDIDNYLYKKLHEATIQYKKYVTDIGCDINFGGCADTGYQIQKTVEGQYYGWHNDSMISENRFVTFIWYLTTHDPVKDGGGTGFHKVCAGGKIVTPEEGKLIFFPATWTYLHMGFPLITKRPKYIITGWLSSPDV